MSDGSVVVMKLSHESYGALYQTGLVDRVLELARARDVDRAWHVVTDATLLARSLDCSWCGTTGLHAKCWTPA